MSQPKNQKSFKPMVCLHPHGTIEECILKLDEHQFYLQTECITLEELKKREQSGRYPLGTTAKITGQAILQQREAP